MNWQVTNHRNGAKTYRLLVAEETSRFRRTLRRYVEVSTFTDGKVVGRFVSGYYRNFESLGAAQAALVEHATKKES